MIFKAMNADEWLRPIFGCKVCQSAPIRMKLELDVKHHLLHLYTKFQIGISKQVANSPENFEKSKMRKMIRQNSENNIFTTNGIYIKKFTAGHLCTKFGEFILISEAMIAKNGFDLLFAVD